MALHDAASEVTSDISATLHLKIQSGEPVQLQGKKTYMETPCLGRNGVKVTL